MLFYFYKPCNPHSLLVCFFKKGTFSEVSIAKIRQHGQQTLFVWLKENGALVNGEFLVAARKQLFYVNTIFVVLQQDIEPSPVTTRYIG